MTSNPSRAVATFCIACAVSLPFFTAMALALICPLARAEDSESPKRPAWVEQMAHREAGGYRYFVGVTSDAPSREEGLEKSWLNAMINAARTQFPALLKVTESSSESLKGADYHREATIAVDRVHWEGLEEDATSGSPFFESREVEGKETVTVYRLLRWQISAIDHERTRLATAASMTGPDSSNAYDSMIGKAGVATGSLTVATDPPGAIVLLDGAFAGKTNAHFSRVGSGEYQLAVQLEGYETVEQQVVVSPGNTTRLDIKLSRNRGKMEIASTPSGAVVYINNVPIVDRTPTTIERNQGDYEVRVEVAGYYSASKVVTLGYQPSSESFELKAKPGRLSVITNPSGADVTAGGQELGKSNVINRFMPGGSYEIKVAKPGFVSQTKTLDINENHGQTAVFKLEPERRSDSAERNQESKEKSHGDQVKVTKRQSQLTRAVWLGIGGTISCVVAGVYQTQADTAFSNYKSATTATQAKGYRSDTDYLDGWAVAYSAIGASLWTAAAYNYFDWGSKDDTNKPAALSIGVVPRASGFAVTMTSVLP